MCVCLNLDNKSEECVLCLNLDNKSEETPNLPSVDCYCPVKKANVIYIQLKMNKIDIY